MVVWYKTSNGANHSCAPHSEVKFVDDDDDDDDVCVWVYSIFCAALMKVLLWLLHPDPRSRATISDLQKDKWTNQPLDDSLLNFDTVFGKLIIIVRIAFLSCDYAYYRSSD